MDTLTSQGTGFARILFEFSSRYAFETSDTDIVVVVDEQEVNGTTGQ